MSPWPKGVRATRALMLLFFCTTVLLAGALVWGWLFVRRLALTPIPFEANARHAGHTSSVPVSPLLVRYRIDLPGRGEIFPALAASNATDYWPVAVLTIANQSDRPVLQQVTAEIPGWTRPVAQNVILGANESRSLRINPELLPPAYANQEIRRGLLQLRVTDATGAQVFAQDRPVMLHSASDLYWGNKFSNAQFVARWVTPHDPAVLQLVAQARTYVPNGRMPGYNSPRGTLPAKVMTAQVRMQAQAIFEALRRSGISYVTSIYTFGNFAGEAQRIRLPRETLTTNTANCIDTSVAFASAIENLGMNPVLVIVPGHAFAGVRLGPQSQEVLYVDLTVLPKGTFAEAVNRANGWLKKTPQNEVLTVDVAAARMLNIYPMPGDTPQQKPALSMATPPTAQQR